MIRSLRFELTDADQLKDRHGFGAKMLEKVREMLKTGHIKRLDALQASGECRWCARCARCTASARRRPGWYSSKGFARSTTRSRRA